MKDLQDAQLTEKPEASESWEKIKWEGRIDTLQKDYFLYLLEAGEN